MESFALIALFFTVLAYALKLRKDPAHAGTLFIFLQTGLVAMAATILRLFWK